MKGETTATAARKIAIGLALASVMALAVFGAVQLVNPPPRLVELAGCGQGLRNVFINPEAVEALLEVPGQTLAILRGGVDPIPLCAAGAYAVELLGLVSQRED